MEITNKDRFIDMCYQATKLQEKWKPEKGDRCYCFEDKKIRILSDMTITHIEHINSDYRILLPRNLQVLDNLIETEQLDPHFTDTFVDDILVFYKYPKECWVFLPTQDQLQKMIDLETTTYGQYIRFAGFVETNCSYIVKNQLSWNEIWLVYIMFWVYKKIWLNDKWIDKERKS